MWGEIQGSGPRRGLVGLALAVAAVVAGGALGSLEGGAPPQTPLELQSPSANRMFEVHVAGWVNSPGVVSVTEGSIVADAIHLAGGLRSGALVDLINLASPLRSGDQVVVPGPRSGSGGGSGEGDLIVLNRAVADELTALPGVGPVLAERIVAYREANGPFSSVEDLLQVPGIGEAKLASIRDLVRVP